MKFFKKKEPEPVSYVRCKMCNQNGEWLIAMFRQIEGYGTLKEIICTNCFLSIINKENK